MGHREVITRTEIESQQADWEARQEVDSSIIHDEGRFYASGDMGNFREVTGPERYYSYLEAVGEAIIIEPTKAQKIGRKVRSLLSFS